MSRSDYQQLLRFSDEWLKLGIVTEEQIESIGRSYEASEDKNTEHYRYSAFNQYLRTHRPLSKEVAEALYALGESDPDRGMGSSMMDVIVRLPECPQTVLERALASGRNHLVRAVERRKAR